MFSMPDSESLLGDDDPKIIAHKRQKNTKIGLKSIQNWGYVYPFLSGICSCQYLSNRKLALKTLRKGILSHVFTLIAYKEHGGNFLS